MSRPTPKQVRGITPNVLNDVTAFTVTPDRLCHLCGKRRTIPVPRPIKGEGRWVMAASLRARPSMAWDMVRYAEPAEFDDVADLLLRANREYRDAMPASIYRAYTEGLRALATDPRLHDDCELLVVGACNALMGAVVFLPDAGAEGVGLPKGWAGMRALAVDPAARGLGLGRRLAEAAIGRARAIGAPIVCLHNAAFQMPARRLYLDLGFVRCPQYDFDAADVPALSPNGDRMPVEAFALRLA